ncbi:MAG: PAS domain-containing protein [Phycisphaerae bacterium]|jgi:PAS domain S-box-containing protein|nr:PAS domain-containing protein [Phycisphaerae bacterium]
MGLQRFTSGWTRGPGLHFRSSGVTRLSLCAIGLASVAAFGVGWWQSARAARAFRGSQVETLRAAAVSAADAVGSLLAAEDLSGARRLVATLAQGAGAAECRIELPNGGILADLVPSRITQREIPVPWPAAKGTEPEAEPVVTASDVSFRVPVSLGGSRSASLIFSAPLPEGTNDAEALLAGATAAGVAAIAVGLAVLMGRGSLRDLLAVGEATAAAAAGEPHQEALLIDERLGAMAPAWNSLLPRLFREESLAGTRSGDSESRTESHDGRGVCDTLWHGILVVDSSRRVRYLNGAAALLLGVRRDAAVGTDVSEMIRHGDTMDAISRATAGDSSVRASFERLSEDGNDEGVLRFSVRPLRSPEGGDAAFILIEDVTQQRLAERSHQAFVAQATHELRTPLTNIRLYSDELLEGDATSTEERGRCLEVISHESRRLERMVGDMLSIAEIDAGTMRLHPDDVRLEPMLKDLERDFRAQAESHHIKLEFRMPPKYPHMVGDRDKIHLTLANLIGNALKYTPDNGTVTVTVRPGQGDVRFEIADSGFGIREDELELVFRSFYRSKDKRVEGVTGTGLGLAIARQIARLHGGDILVASAIDRGSTFTLVLPLEGATQAVAAAA